MTETYDDGSCNDVKSNRRSHMTDGVLYTRNLILRGMTAIYLMAFITFYYQSPGKYDILRSPIFDSINYFNNASSQFEC